ncbi:HAD-IA family hydrolase [Alterisphingorhabdus coralli]|uniref:HAD-IA family hydrolase n=1 Tax=Alterisphingorhabdus coralli TaxID=3071408 RepID=A0AA97F517_9SPHN|nr:HAD-IA family hydrolase [Parasphingorhabdus sp. SCSIO 66989]WOE74459.1 HAD-IA family hydrolase [Parasphingorhabdus sp. SCSIO 66989]
MTRLAIFDCDGTMVDGQANICTAMEQAFVAENLTPPDHHLTRRIVGLSLIEAMRRLAPEPDDALHERLAENYRQAFQALRAKGDRTEPLYGGLIELLEKLRAAEWLCAVATGKSDRGLKFVVEHYGIADHFISLQTADRHPSKPHPSMIMQALDDAGAAPAGAVMIGDTSFDMEMAINAGVRAIGVDWGYHDAHELHAAGAEQVVTSMDALFDALNEGTSHG